MENGIHKVVILRKSTQLIQISIIQELLYYFVKLTITVKVVELIEMLVESLFSQDQRVWVTPDHGLDKLDPVLVPPTEGGNSVEQINFFPLQEYNQDDNASFMDKPLNLIITPESQQRSR